MRSRTQAREAALKGLYQLDLRSSVPEAELEELLAHECEQRDAQDYARILIKGTRRELDGIDKEIKEVAENWDLGRMAAIDRNVLRMAIFELKNRDDIPPAVAINEAVTIAKKYSTKDSGGFVNGILDQIKNRLAARGALAAKTDPREPVA
ncbi:MAG TPA: transcription antitermination factor NusB [Planctomycetota bacterium]|nr:transcription antitermination factor NusB [Planctomycetota bacterium]